MALFAFICIFLFSLSSCGGGGVRSSAIMHEMIECADDLPAGRIYTTESSEGSSDYLSESLFSSIYFESGEVSLYEKIKSGAVWLTSGLYASEFAVFECASRRDLEGIAELCLNRIEKIKHLVRVNSDELGISDDIKNKLDGGKVMVIGNYVIMVLGEHEEGMIRTAKEIIS